MAIRLSWVSRGWREMTTNCPFLWRRLSLNGTKYSQSIKRIRVFGDRGQGKLNHIRIDPLPPKDIPQFANALRPFLRNTQSLSIRTTFGISLDDFIAVLQSACRHLEVLSVHVESDISRLAPPQELHLGLSATSTESRLRSIKLVGVTLGYMAKSSDSVEPAYDSLKSLVLDQCRIVPTEPADGGTDTSTLIDVVQSTIRRANNLEHLEIRNEENLASMPTKYLGSATRLEKLKVLVIPAPDVWAINIETPQLRKLAISNTQRYGEYLLNGLLPSLKQLAPLQIPVAELETLEVVVDDHDNQAALRSWLMRLANVKELAIVSQTPYQENAVSWGSDISLIQMMLDAVNNKVVSVLHERQEWCPQMHSLRLVQCLIPAKELMEYVMARKSHSHLTTIRDLTLDNCSTLPIEAETWLQRNVENFKIVKRKPTPKGWRDKLMRTALPEAR